MIHQVRLLGQLIDRKLPAATAIQLVQLGPGRTIEVAFTEIPPAPPPPNWVATADRVGRLDAQLVPEPQGASREPTALQHVLVPLGTPQPDQQLYLNIKSCSGVNVAGEDAAVRTWLAFALQTIVKHTPGSRRPLVVFVGERCDEFVLTEEIRIESEHDAIVRATASLPGHASNSLFRWPGRDQSCTPSVILIAGTAEDPRWDQIAAAPSTAVLSIGQRFSSGLDINLADGALTVPTLGISASLASITQPEHGAQDEPDDDWQPPSWPIMINVLGTPRATRHGDPIKLTPQQLSALALIAIRRELPAHDFKRAIWGDEDDVSAERVRDTLSVLRKKVGGLDVIPKREDGLVCAGPHLGSDVLIFEALASRAQVAPSERSDRLRQMLELVTDRPFNYANADQTWWRWSEIAFGMTDWTAKTTAAAETLARLHLGRSSPAVARDVAERGLTVDPLNAALTEVLMEAHAELGSLESAQRVYDSHVRQLAMSELGDASNETRLVLDRLRSRATAATDNTSEHEA